MNDSLQEFVQPEPEIGEITDKVAEELKNENEGVVMESLVSVFLPEKKLHESVWFWYIQFQFFFRISQI